MGTIESYKFSLESEYQVFAVRWGEQICKQCVIVIREQEQLIIMDINQLLIILSLICLSVGQRRRFLKNVIEKIRNSPKHESFSPSFNGERQFEVIGTGRLPLEHHSYQRGSEIFYQEYRKADQTTKKPGPSFLGTNNM